VSLGEPGLSVAAAFGAAASFLGTVAHSSPLLLLAMHPCVCMRGGIIVAATAP
jgi:hypothetical protein